MNTLKYIVDQVNGHLSAAIIQSLPKDDQIIMDHVKAAHVLLNVVKTVEAPDLIDRAALLKILNKERDDYVREHGNYDHTTGQTEFGKHGEEYYGELCERIEFIENFPPSTPNQ